MLASSCSNSLQFPSVPRPVQSLLRGYRLAHPTPPQLHSRLLPLLSTSHLSGMCRLLEEEGRSPASLPPPATRGTPADTGQLCREPCVVVSKR